MMFQMAREQRPLQLHRRKIPTAPTRSHLPLVRQTFPVLFVTSTEPLAMSHVRWSARPPPFSETNCMFSEAECCLELILISRPTCTSSI